MTRRETLIFALVGFLVWLQGAVMFRFGGAFLFESGPLVLGIASLVIAAAVCLLLKATMDWRKAPAAQSVRVAVVMALPGLFGNVGYILFFPEVSGLRPETVGPYAAAVVFGNAALLAYALTRR